jgi:hypothetical protein
MLLGVRRQYEWLYAELTQMYKELIESEHKVTLLTYPSAWHKSTLFESLSYFLQNKTIYGTFEINKEINQFFYQRLYNFDNLIDCKNGRPLWITKDKAFLDSYLKKKLCVYIDFSRFDVGKNWCYESTVNGIKKCLFETTSYTKFLFSNILKETAQYQALSEEKQQRILYFIETKYECYENKGCEIETILDCVKWVIQVLYDFLGVKIFVVFDSYDSPLLKP